jgi:hypothetical protein
MRIGTGIEISLLKVLGMELGVRLDHLREIDPLRGALRAPVDHVMRDSRIAQRLGSQMAQRIHRGFWTDDLIGLTTENLSSLVMALRAPDRYSIPERGTPPPLQESAMEGVVEEIERGASLLRDRFSVHTVAVPELGAAYGLGRRLSPRVRVHFIPAETADDWIGLAGFILHAHTEPGDVIFVASSASGVDPRALHRSLQAVNLTRDTFGRRQACPLYWCGDQETLRAVWEAAPDFWSVRGVGLRI